MSNVFFVHLQFFFVEICFVFFKLIEQIFFYSPIFSFSARHTSQNHRSHHSITPWWIYRIPSELRSQAPLGPISTAVGDHAGILGVECFFLAQICGGSSVFLIYFSHFFFVLIQDSAELFFLAFTHFLVDLQDFIVFSASESNACRTHLQTEEKKKKKKTNRQTKAKSHAIVTTR